LTEKQVVYTFYFSLFRENIYLSHTTETLAKQHHLQGII